MHTAGRPGQNLLLQAANLEWFFAQSWQTLFARTPAEIVLLHGGTCCRLYCSTTLGVCTGLSQPLAQQQMAMASRYRGLA
jgi:hypothetical protein